MGTETKKAKILVIEDDVFIIELLAKDLEDAGFEVVVARNGNDGIIKIEEEKPSLLLLDLMLPGLNGFDVLRKLREMPEGSGLKVIILSNVAEGADMEEAKKLGAVEYLVKANYTLPEIVERVKKALA